MWVWVLLEVRSDAVVLLLLLLLGCMRSSPLPPPPPPSYQYMHVYAIDEWQESHQTSRQASGQPSTTLITIIATEGCLLIGDG